MNEAGHTTFLLCACFFACLLACLVAVCTNMHVYGGGGGHNLEVWVAPSKGVSASPFFFGPHSILAEEAIFFGARGKAKRDPPPNTTWCPFPCMPTTHTHVCTSTMCLSLSPPPSHSSSPPPFLHTTKSQPPKPKPSKQASQPPPQNNKHGLHPMPRPRPRPGSNPPKSLQQPSSQELGPLLPFHPGRGRGSHHL